MDGGLSPGAKMKPAEESSLERHTGRPTAPAVPAVPALLLFLLLSGSTSVRAVNVTSPSPVVRGTLGGDALLSVAYASRSPDAPVVKWQLRRERDAKPVTVVQSVGAGVIGSLRPEYRGRVLVLLNGSLLLRGLRATDEGTYEVEVSITDDVFTGDGRVDLTVDVPVSRPYVQMLASSVLEHSEGFHLHCSHDNGSKPTYGWLKGGKVVTNDSRLLLSRDAKVLTIAQVAMADDDVYACTVENPIGGLRSAPVKLTVYKRSSLYIVLSTGGIFLLITLVTVCACWKPSKKRRQSALQRAPVYVEPSEIGYEVDVVPKAMGQHGRRSPLALYVLAEDELPHDDGCSGNSHVQSEHGSPHGCAHPPEGHAHSALRYPRSPVPSPHRPPAPGPALHPPASSPRVYSHAPPTPARPRPHIGLPDDLQAGDVAAVTVETGERRPSPPPLPR